MNSSYLIHSMFSNSICMYVCYNYLWPRSGSSILTEWLGFRSKIIQHHILKRHGSGSKFNFHQTPKKDPYPLLWTGSVTVGSSPPQIEEILTSWTGQNTVMITNIGGLDILKIFGSGSIELGTYLGSNPTRPKSLKRVNQFCVAVGCWQIGSKPG